MPDMHELVAMHGSIRKMRVKVAIEHADGFVHEIAVPPTIAKTGMSADNFHAEMLKVANFTAIANIETDVREKQARSKR